PSARDTSTSDDRSPEATAAHETVPVPATDVADAAAAIADSAAVNDIVAPAAAVEASDEPVSAASLEAEPVPPAEPVKDFAPVESLPREGTSLSAMKLDEVSLNADAPEAAASGEMDRGITDLRPGEIEPELATEFNFRELVTESLKAEPPSSDRVITVDEFRAREIANARQDRTRQRGLRDRGLPPRVVPPPVPDLTEHDAGASSVPDEERARERFAMFPLAIGLIIGLLIGYGGGYFVGNREREAPSVVQNAPASELATPGTSGQTPSKTDTEQRVNPKSGGAPPVPSDTLAGRPSATSGARAAGKPPAPAATNKPTAAAKPTAKPSAPKAVTPPSAPRSGQMIITSTPSRAGVTIDGKWSGRTPLTLDNRRFGSYKIRVVQKGYEVASTTLTISAADPKARFDPALQATPAKTEKPAPPPSAAPKPAAPATSTPQAKPSASAAAAPKPTAKTGEIFVDSRPQGATVLVDGKPVGVTPLRLTGQPAGSHTVRLELADHQPWTSTTTVIGGQTARVTGSMERIR
ncbi:MAG TPA: PEGA domain-containing protein, partial [Vicinamibacterales bacterium]|nr:PEGA domain-containing protein [Vicinamibacterales bacterium]